MNNKPKKIYKPEQKQNHDINFHPKLSIYNQIRFEWWKCGICWRTEVAWHNNSERPQVGQQYIQTCIRLG